MSHDVGWYLSGILAGLMVGFLLGWNLGVWRTKKEMNR